jgi:glycosyltransferase involved in cell wall biosynthesis
MTTRALHVALVSEHASPLSPLGHPETGGQNVYIDGLARHLARLGCRVDVFTRRADARTPACVPLAEGVAVHHVPAGPPAPVARDELMPLMPEFADGLAAAWRASTPDIVHAHFWMSGWASTVAAGASVPVVQTFHALGSVKRRHQGASDTSPPERMATERRLLRTVDTVIATCRDEIRELRLLGGSLPTVLVPCGIGEAFSAFGPVDRRPRRPRHRLVCVSRLVPRKGIADAIRAMSLLPERLDTELIVVGGADAADVQRDEEAARLAELADALGVGDRVELRGRLGTEEVAAVMRSADVVVCAPWYEPFGIVPVEAMACGVPVVGTAVGGLLDTVVEGTTGLLVPPQRPERLAAALDELLRDPHRRRRMGSAGARRANGYRWPRVAAAVLDAYQATRLRHGQTASQVEAVLA